MTGINITYKLLVLCSEKDGKFDSFFLKYGASVDTFNELYCLVFVRLHSEWMSDRPVKGIMAFNERLDKLLDHVANDAKAFKLNRLSSKDLVMNG